jgi:hypothetical protein
LTAEHCDHEEYSSTGTASTESAQEVMNMNTSCLFVHIR